MSDIFNRPIQLKISQLCKTFDRVKAVDHVDLDIHQGEIFALLGASGCGKSTLLRMLGGFETPTSGSIMLKGKPMEAIPPYKRPVNMMFQSYALFPHMTVAQNIAFGLKQDGLSKAKIKEKTDHVLSLVRMQDFAKRKPHQLSGGQQQRVALARSLAKEPELLLLDEPMGALDKKLRNEMQLEIVDIIETVGVTCLMVTHDQEEAMTMADRIGIMDKGVLRQVGKPTDIYEQPNSRMTAEFIGSVNIFDGKLSVDEPDRLEIESPDLEQPIKVAHGITGILGMPLSYAIRPEKMTISKQAPETGINQMRGIIEDIAYMGSHYFYYVRLPSGKRISISSTNKERQLSGHDDTKQLTWKDNVFISFDSCSGVVLTA